MTELRDELERLGWRTADGLPVAREPPYGATVVVSRPDGTVLLLHRAHRDPDDAGEWAWGPPAGARLPGEAAEACARRELVEETGLELPLEPAPRAEGGDGDGDWLVFTAAAPRDAAVRLSPEHEAAVWLPLEEAVPRCLPASVGAQLRAAAAR